MQTQRQKSLAELYNDLGAFTNEDAPAQNDITKFIERAENLQIVHKGHMSEKGQWAASRFNTASYSTQHMKSIARYLRNKIRATRDQNTQKSTVQNAAPIV